VPNDKEIEGMLQFLGVPELLQSQSQEFHGVPQELTVTCIIMSGYHSERRAVTD
jgi:hypothetical protein